MERTPSTVGSLLEYKSSVLFDKLKKVTNFYSSNYVCVALLKEDKTTKDVKNELTLIECTLSFKTSSKSQIIAVEDENVGEKVVIFYASDQEEFDWLVDYHSYSNSIILGKLLKSVGFKFNEDGLQYQHKHIKENHQVVIGQIDICKDYKKILNIIGLDHSEYQNEIKCEEDLFKFFLKSPYLNASKFVSSEKEFSNVVMINLERYIILNNIESNYTALTFDMVTSHFPEIDFEGQIEEFKEIAIRKKGINDKFNGRVILDSISGYDPKNLNGSIHEFKESFSSKELYENFVISNTQEQIIEKFKETTMAI